MVIYILVFQKIWPKFKVFFHENEFAQNFVQQLVDRLMLNDQSFGSFGISLIFSF